MKHFFIARSTAGYGVHSPFMFDFLVKVVRGKGNPAIMRPVEALRREMLRDDRVIQMVDLGTGNDRERKIRDIAGSDSLSSRYVSLLARMVGELRIKNYELRIKNCELRGADNGASASERTNGGIRGVSDVSLKAGEHGVQGMGRGAKSQEPGAGSGEDLSVDGQVEQAGDSGIILELGTSLGITTLALALAAPERRIVSVEGCPQLAAIARENLGRHGATNAQVINMEFDDALEKITNEKTSVSFAFIDGNHRGEALKHYVQTVREMGEEMIIVADDVHINSDMYRAWSSLAESASTPASLETFRAGMIFFLNKLTPGHYRIRY